MTFLPNTYLADLPYGMYRQIVEFCNENDLWSIIFSDTFERSPYNVTPAERERYRRNPNQGYFHMQILTCRGQTAEMFGLRCDELSKTHGPVFDIPQLIIRRQFVHVFWSRKNQITVDPTDEDYLTMRCWAGGFPTPRYLWIEDDNPLENATLSTLTILRCRCTIRNVFKCKVWNIVESDQPWSAHYYKPGKIYQSELVSDLVDLTSFMTDRVHSNCLKCNKTSVDDICRFVEKMTWKNFEDKKEAIDTKKVKEAKKAEETKDDDESNNLDDSNDSMSEFFSFGDVIASDKVALIISNRTYAPNLTNLVTPHCDAETLADALQQLKFKTVTLGDLRLSEMKNIIQEYRKLLDDGVYAVFYFVGHGFECNGQCYLLPIDAPPENFTPDNCLSIEWVLSIFKNCNPGLNLILLDICRKFLPTNIEAFNKHTEIYQCNQGKVSRNTIFGYATSPGVGAYEVQGEFNGIFMKYLKNRISERLTVIDMLNRVFRDIENDKQICDVQVPELRSNLTRPCSLLDPILFEGHTKSYDHHTIQWHLMHELPNPVHLKFLNEQLLITIWFDYCGHFTNKVYVFSSVVSLNSEPTSNNFLDAESIEMLTEEPDSLVEISKSPESYRACLIFPSEYNASKPKLCNDEEEGASLRIMLSNLQRCKGGLNCLVQLRRITDDEKSKPINNLGVGHLVASKEIKFGHLLITRFNYHVFN